MEDSKQQDGKSKADRAWDNIVEAFSPIASLFTMRTVFLVALLAGIGFWIGWRDIKLFALSAAWAIAGVAIAYHGRKFLVPEVKAKEYYDLAKEGNIAAAIVTLRIAVVEVAIIFVVAFAALRAGV